MPCTRSQAEYLIENWDEVWQHVALTNKKKSKRSYQRKKARRKTRWNWTVKKFQAAYTIAQAGYFIKCFRVAIGDRKKSWSVNLPARDILGLSSDDTQKVAIAFRKAIAQNAHFKYTMSKYCGDYESWKEDYIKRGS